MQQLTPRVAGTLDELRDLCERERDEQGEASAVAASLCTRRKASLVLGALPHHAKTSKARDTSIAFNYLATGASATNQSPPSDWPRRPAREGCKQLGPRGTVESVALREPRGASRVFLLLCSSRNLGLAT